MYVCAYANYATWTTFLKRTDISVCKYLYIVHRPTNIYNAKYIAPSAHMETCINYSQFRQVLVCNLSPITYIHTSYLLLSSCAPLTSRNGANPYVCMYGRGAGRPANPLPNSHTLSLSHATYPYPCPMLPPTPMYVTFSCSPTFPSSFRSKTGKEKKTRESRVLNYVPALPPCEKIWWCYSFWLTHGVMWLPCDKYICGEKMPIESLLHNPSCPSLIVKLSKRQREQRNAEFFKKERFSFHPVHTTWYRWRQAHTIDTSDEEAECPLRMRY